MGPRGLAAQDFTVIVHRDNPVQSLTRQQVADLFLRRTRAWPDGQAVRPVDQIAAASVREAFSRAVLGKATTAVVSYWQQQVFAGRSAPPPERQGDAAVVAFVQGDPGAIGYVSGASAPGGVKPVAITP
jgi:ABC-type phosphate transport system substrate-binding protein